MTNKIFKLAFTCLLTFCTTQLAEAGYLREYTKEKPLPYSKASILRFP